MRLVSVGGRARRVGACWKGCRRHQGPSRDQKTLQNQKASGGKTGAGMRRVPF
jgi:hypothetical protein